MTILKTIVKVMKFTETNKILFKIKIFVWYYYFNNGVLLNEVWLPKLLDNPLFNNPCFVPK